MPIETRLDRMLVERKMTLGELADRIGITVANLSILKTGKAKAGSDLAEAAPGRGLVERVA